MYKPDRFSLYLLYLPPHSGNPSVSSVQPETQKVSLSVPSVSCRWRQRAALTRLLLLSSSHLRLFELQTFAELKASKSAFVCLRDSLVTVRKAAFVLYEVEVSVQCYSECWFEAFCCSSCGKDVIFQSCTVVSLVTLSSVCLSE